jgi:hypothetical protein
MRAIRIHRVQVRPVHLVMSVVINITKNIATNATIHRRLHLAIIDVISIIKNIVTNVTMIIHPRPPDQALGDQVLRALLIPRLATPQAPPDQAPPDQAPRPRVIRRGPLFPVAINFRVLRRKDPDPLTG